MISLNIDKITGNVSAQGYEGGILVTNYQSSASLPIHQRTGQKQNRITDALHFHPLSFTKMLDKSTTDLLQYFYNATVIPQLTFNSLTTGSPPKCFLKQTFEHVLFSGHEAMATPDGHVELYTLEYLKSETRFISLDDTHSLTSPQSSGYDVIAGKSI